MMRAEDVKVGEWYRSTVPACAPVVRCVELLADGWFNASSLDGVVFMCRASLNEPWAPRVGDWVRWEGRRVDRGGLTREAWRVESVHDGGCAGANRDGGFVHSFRAPDCRLIPAPPPTQAVGPSKAERDAFLAKLQGVSRAYEERIALELLNRPRPVGSLFGIDASTYKIADYVEPVIAPPAPRGNTACIRCGGPAYAGLLHVECMAVKCESPAELEPDALELVAVFRRGWSGDEMVWEATGRGVTRRHPTIEGAAAAWRLAVGGGR